MDKRFIGILVVLTLMFVGIFAFNQKSATNSSSSVSATNHIIGNPSGPVLVEYGDYQCPVCFSYYQPLKEVAEQIGAVAGFQFRNLPLSQIHLNAYSSARAAEAAGIQDKFWEMHGLLYQNQDTTGQSGWVSSKNVLEDYYIKYAQQIGLNLDQFRQDYASSKVNDSINADVSEFKKTGQPMATPTFFLDGQHIETSKLVDDKTGQISTTKIVALINEAVAKRSQ